MGAQIFADAGRVHERPVQGVGVLAKVVHDQWRREPAQVLQVLGQIVVQHRHDRFDPVRQQLRRYESAARSPVAPSTTSSGWVCVSVSHTLGPLPSTFQAPSIWYAAVAAPNRKFAGNLSSSPGCCNRYRCTVGAPDAAQVPAAAGKGTMRPGPDPAQSASACPS
uniref:Uncharacterized protein n=1 Tax=Anopheles melas TaxID=34690 RepID=A0A182TI17_9DIPT